MYGQKERGDLMSPKGRPTDNPKKGRFEIRTSQEEEEMLDYCCEITGKKRTDIINWINNNGRFHPFLPSV